MSTYCTTLTVLHHTFSLLSLSVASPVTPTVSHFTLQHYYLVSLLSQEARLLIIIFRRHYPFQICHQIHNLHYTKAFQHHVQILCILSQTVRLPAF